MSTTAITGATYVKYDLPPKVLSKTSSNAADLLYKVTLPDADEDAGFAMVYSKTALVADAPVPAAAVFLQNQDGSLFSVDTADDAVVSLVTEGKNLSLYVYTPDAAGVANRYTFNGTTGIATTEDEQPAVVDALALSTAEVKTLRDLDGSGGTIGAKLDATVPDAAGGLYKVKVAGQDLYVTGLALDKAKTLDIAKTTLLNTDGSYWAPDSADSTLRAVSKVNADKSVTWQVYATNTDTHEVTRYAFDKNLKLQEGDEGTTLLTAAQAATDEKTFKRDLDGDSYFGVDISTTLDSKTGLYKGSMLGQTFYLAGTGLKDGTAAAPTDMTGQLLDTSGEAWLLDEGSYSVGAAVLGTGDSANTLTLYTYEGSAETGVHNQVYKYTFTRDEGTGNYTIDEDSQDGLEVDATELAAAEKAALRDLNKDSVYGVAVQGAADATGGLYRARALGNDYLVVGRSVTSSASKPFDLSTTLLNADGTAWSADDISTLDASKLRIVTHLDNSKAVTGYDVYAKEDSGTFAKYSFGADYKLSDEGRLELSMADLAAAEKTTGRDLNMDGAFGAVIDNPPVDTKGGLYKASFGDIEKVYLHETSVPAAGSKVAGRAVSLANALRTEDGQDYWDLDDPEGFSIKAAYADSDGNYNVMAVSNTDVNAVQRYVFADGQLSETQDLTLADLSALEATAKRDLNGDGITGVKILTTKDKVGGLQLGTAAGRDYLLVGSNPKGLTDLSTALVNSEGAAWGTTADGTFDTEIFDKTTDTAVLTQDGDNHKLFVARKNDDATTTVHQYSFDASYTLIEDDDTGKELSDIELADAEKASSRDIDGDKSMGAKVGLSYDKAGGLYQAQLNGHNFYVLSASTPDKKGIALGDKVLLDADEESAWQPASTGTLTGVVTRKNDSDEVTGYWVYESDGANTITRHAFNADRVYQESEEISRVQLAEDEKAAGRDLSGDKTVGVKVGLAQDKTGGLYQANILGQNYFVVGSNLKTGNSSANAVDLSKALLDVDSNAWATEDAIAGAYLDDSTGIYAVYTYQKDDTGNVTSVQKSTWNRKFEYQDTVEADPVELISLETDKKRDFSGDGLVGFRALSTKSVAEYRGVTQARVSNDTAFWLVGDAVKQGSKTNPLSLKNALLNADGTGPWYLDSEHFIKAVDDSGDDRKVYVTDAEGSNVLRFSFDKDTGRVKNDNEAETMTGAQLAEREMALKRDLNDDAVKGAQFVSAHGTTGLLNVKVMNVDYLVVGKTPATGTNIDLSKALLDADGLAWQPEDGITLQGVYVNSDSGSDVYEVYATDGDGATVRYSFVQTEDASTLSLQPYEDDEGNAATDSPTGVEVALREARAGRDLNADTRIGFKVGDAIDTQSNGWAVGHAGVGDADADQIYIVGRNLAQMGSKTSNLANNAALVESVAEDTGLPTYWKPDEGYTIASIVQTADATGATTGIAVYAKQDEAGDDASDNYLRYDFEADVKDDGTTNYWKLVAASDEANGTAVDPVALAKAEVAAKRDLNHDDAWGLTIQSDPMAVSNSLSKLFTASIDGQNFMLVGSNLATGSALLPQGFGGLLVDATDDHKAWTPGDATISSFGKVSHPGVGDVPADAVYEATLSDDSVVYFKAGENNTWVQLEAASA